MSASTRIKSARRHPIARQSCHAGQQRRRRKTEDPGALKVFGFKDGVLSKLASIAPGNGLGFGPRHLDFHPSAPFVYVSLERQNRLYVYGLQSDSTLSRDPLFMKESLADPRNAHPGQAPAPSMCTRTARFVYQANRNANTGRFPGQEGLRGAARTTWRSTPSTRKPASRR